MKRKGRDESHPVDGHTPFPNRILRVQLPRHLVKSTDMKYDESTDPLEHLRNFKHRMICDGVIDEVKCRAFFMTLTGLDSNKFTSLPAGSISTFAEVKELFLTEFTTNSLASQCLTNGLTNDDFIKQLTTKPVWSRKEMQVIAKEFIHHEEVSRVVPTTKNPQTHTAPPVNAQPHNPRDNQRDSGFKGQPKPPKQKFNNYTPLVASITEIYQQISEKDVLPELDP
ncbi:hypothetical protein PIB30_043452 [Stylosanthes scabra]|uniref:Uncharacterized protein n=1 Tax=Stylosanthes scabra TaxID=79078 RepID=A0ABU6XDA9_9FABA|nr:hypothetical protein [Stylosanthes scabra]